MSQALARLADGDARQWQRLRQLHVQRERRALAQARAAEARARDSVSRREHGIAQQHQALQALARHWGGAGCVDLPRWAGQLAAHRAVLHERLERDEYALIDEQQALHGAQQQVQRCRAALARAQARESAVDATLADRQRLRLGHHEQQAELEADDTQRSGAPPA
ncbi:hypothetical protein [Aquabacterium sp. OR-4]|uniref:hypothetical protein n=1 Tax=Aquabacterium sp. OR-4 TaxID=2978127 RepID=UPI0021B4C867|nr:hypothetical protein [Aquabacterium sp. OR-4]MDT7837967.1 hypothetical protein [Aquabacterium sp. OR-4]